MGNQPTRPTSMDYENQMEPQIISLQKPHDEVHRTFEVEDGKMLWLRCPNGKIVIEKATYEAVDKLCYIEATSLLSIYTSFGSGHELKVLVTPANLGGDPCPGFKKKLTIRIRCRNWGL